MSTFRKLILFSLLILGCKSHEKTRDNEITSPSIVFLKSLGYIDSSKSEMGIHIARVEYFLVKCDGLDSDQVKIAIDSFARKRNAKSPCPYDQCNMLYFKETGETNEKTIHTDKDLIDTYSMKNDLLFEYIWDHKILEGVNEWSNGLIVNPKATIIIKNARSFNR